MWPARCLRVPRGWGREGGRRHSLTGPGWQPPRGPTPLHPHARSCFWPFTSDGGRSTGSHSRQPPGQLSPADLSLRSATVSQGVASTAAQFLLPGCPRHGFLPSWPGAHGCSVPCSAPRGHQCVASGLHPMLPMAPNCSWELHPGLGEEARHLHTAGALLHPPLLASTPGCPLSILSCPP